jgi:hypothetical protein
MWKHVVAQSLVQFSLVLFLYLYAPQFIEEDHPNRQKMIQQLENCFGDFVAETTEFKNHMIKYYIMDGKKSSWDPLKHIRRNLSPKACLFFDENRFDPKQITNLYEAFKWYISEYGNTCHMTIIFNTFVLYSLFNQINSRVINDNFNILYRILDNWMFLTVTGVELLIQICIVQYGGLVFKCSVDGLTLSQWMWCLGMASITFGVSILMKCFKLENLCIKNDDKGIFYKKSKFGRNDPNLNRNLLSSEVDDIDRALEVEMGHVRNGSSDLGFLSNPQSS